MPKVLTKRAIRRPINRNTAPQNENPLAFTPTENAGIEPLKPEEDLPVLPAPATAPEEAERPPSPVERSSQEELCPDPTYKSYHSDDINQGSRTNHLWRWWGELPEKFKSKISAYVYRTYPPLIDPPADSKDYKYIDVVTAPFKADRDLNDRYGAGDFRVYVNISEKKGRTLATAYIKGNRDFKSMPPADRRITELDQKGRPRWIDVNDPQCKSYVEFLRTRGLMPEAWEAKKEAEMEQQADVLKTVLGMQRELIDKATAKKEDNATPLHETVGKVIDTAMAGAKAGQEILKNTIETLQGQLAKGNNNQTTAETLNTVLDIAEKISKQSDPKPYMEMIAKLNETVASLQMDRLNDKIEQLRSAQQPSPASPQQSLSTLIEEFRKIQDLIGGEERGPRLPGWLAAAQALADPLSRIVGNITQAFMVSRMQPGMGGIPMPPVTPPPGYAPPPPPQPAPGPMSTVDPAVYAPPANAAPAYRDPRLYPNQEMYEQPAPPPQAPPQIDPLLMLLAAIQAPLLNQFRDGLAGDDFADWFIGGYGEATYAELIGRASQTARQSGLSPHHVILAMIDSYAPLARELAQEKRQSVERFVKEFAEFDAAAYDAKRGRESGADASAA